METPGRVDVVELLTQIGLKNAQELKLLIQDTENIPSVADKYSLLYQEKPKAKQMLCLLFDNYPFIPESTGDLISILHKTQRIFQFFSEQNKVLNEEEFENGIKHAYKLAFKILYNKPEEVFKEEFLKSLEGSPDRKDSVKKTLDKNRYHFIRMLRVIIDQGHIIWGESISYFEPMFRDRLEVYQIKEPIFEELLQITRDVEVSFFLGAYLYLFFVILRTAT